MRMSSVRAAVWLCLTISGIPVVDAWAQVGTFIADVLIIDDKLFQLDAQAKSFLSEILKSAREAPEGWDERAQATFGNMLVISAAELALVRSMGDDGSLSLPVRIRKGDLIAGLLIWDTADGSRCETPARIANGKGLRASDVLLFGGDGQKLENLGLSAAELVKVFHEPGKFETFIEAMNRDIAKSGRSKLIGNVIKSKYFTIRQFLLRTKAHIATSREVETVKKEAEVTAKRLGLR